MRLQVAFPVGYTGGWDVLHGFTWGFRGGAAVHSKAGFAIGAFGEVLLDADTHHMSALGGTLSYPVYIWPGTDTDFVWRLGAYGGVRFAEGSPDRRGAVGLVTQIAMPFYLYEASLGLRLDATIHEGISAGSILVEIDVLALGALVLRRR